MTCRSEDGRGRSGGGRAEEEEEEEGGALRSSQRQGSRERWRSGVADLESRGENFCAFDRLQNFCAFDRLQRRGVCAVVDSGGGGGMT